MPEDVDASPGADELVDEPFAVTVLGSAVEFHGRVWDVRRDRFEYGSSAIAREYVDHTGAVAILALDENDRARLIRQYRHPIATRDWEIPAGLLDIEDEDPLVAAQRELAEEADLRASEWSLLVDFFTSPGGSTEAIRVYLARGLSETPAFDRAEEEAELETRWASPSAISCCSERLMHTRTSSGQRAASAQAVRITHSPMRRIRLLSSAIGMKTAGDMGPCSGLTQRSSASKPTVTRLSRSTIA